MVELTFRNKTFNIKAKLYDEMIKLEGRYYVDKMPKDASKHPMKYRKLKNGRVSVYAEFFIPSAFVFDAIYLDNEEIKQKVSVWIEKLIKDVAAKRSVDSITL